MEIELVPLNRGKPTLRIRIPPNPQPEDVGEYTPFTDDELETPSPDVFRASLKEFIDPYPPQTAEKLIEWLYNYPEILVRVDEEIGVFFFRGPGENLVEMSKDPMYKVMANYIYEEFKVWMIHWIPI